MIEYLDQCDKKCWVFRAADDVLLKQSISVVIRTIVTFGIFLNLFWKKSSSMNRDILITQVSMKSLLQWFWEKNQEVYTVPTRARQRTRFFRAESTRPGFPVPGRAFENQAQKFLSRVARLVAEPLSQLLTVTSKIVTTLLVWRKCDYPESG